MDWSYLRFYTNDRRSATVFGQIPDYMGLRSLRRPSIIGLMTNDPAGRRVHEWTRGDRLRAARENMPGSPSQAAFATAVGVARTTIVRYERDDPGTDKPIMLIRWAEVTGFDLDWLLHGDQPTSPEPTSSPRTNPDTEVVTLGQAPTLHLVAA